MKTKAYYRSKGATLKLSALKARVKWMKQSYKPSARLPETAQEIYSVFFDILCDLSPENLHCDGEITVAQAIKKGKMLMREWKDLETLLGRKVSENEVMDTRISA